jgi:hypothetical protein
VPSEKYLRYHRPIPPADPNQEYMTVQETAYVLKCGVTWLRGFLKENPKLRALSGRSIITDRAARAAIYRARTGAPKPAHRVPRQRDAA